MELKSEEGNTQNHELSAEPYLFLAPPRISKKFTDCIVKLREKARKLCEPGATMRQVIILPGAQGALIEGRWDDPQEPPVRKRKMHWWLLHLQEEELYSAAWVFHSREGKEKFRKAWSFNSYRVEQFAKARQRREKLRAEEYYPARRTAGSN